MKISYLGIDNTYKDGAVSAGDYTTDPHLIAKIDFATEALRRWAAKYPNDPQLARSYFLGVIVMRKVYTQAEQDMAWQFMHILVTKYPKTYFGKTTKTQMAGFTEHVMGEAEPARRRSRAAQSPSRRRVRRRRRRRLPDIPPSRWSRLRACSPHLARILNSNSEPRYIKKALGTAEGFRFGTEAEA